MSARDRYVTQRQKGRAGLDASTSRGFRRQWANDGLSRDKLSALTATFLGCELWSDDLLFWL